MTPNPKDTRLNRLHFDNKFTRELPCDTETDNFRRQVASACYSRVAPTPVAAPEMVAFSKEAANLIGLDDSDCQSDLFTRVFTGNHVLSGMDPFAMCYGGHQFGNWAGQLGDGRAINLGEVVNSSRERWMLQLKGAGPTPYSRSADGLAVLRSSIREFLCSEAMFHLGVPTTRALSLTLTGEKVVRDMFYDGHPKEEPGAVVCRMAPSFTRFGNFQILAARGETDLLKQFMDYTIDTDFPHLNQTRKKDYAAWFKDICDRTMDMIIDWMRVGFVHGVMNTDNMSVLGLTIDYGPYGWLEDYNPDWTPNTTDLPGRRYCFKNQPGIALWNLGQMANAIVPVLGRPEPLQEIMDEVVGAYTPSHQAMMAKKLGILNYEQANDDPLITGLTGLLRSIETDYTLFFRQLALFDPDQYLGNRDLESQDLENQKLESGRLPPFLQSCLYKPEQADKAFTEQMFRWLKLYGLRLQKEGRSQKERQEQMNRTNPKYVLRNYLSQQAIDKAEQGDFSIVWELLDLLRRPYEDQPEKEKFAEKRPEWARHKPGCSMLSCSS